jgi:ComF family protein
MGWVANAVRSFKYAEEWDRGADLGARLTPVVQDFGSLDGIVPVPLHPRKHRQRGYNQAELLAREVSKSLGIPLMPSLKRDKETRPQVELGRDDREANVRDAFVLDPDWWPAAGGRYLLLDDVRTTGATVGACARTLLQTSPEAIFVATIALDIPASTLRDWLAEHAAVEGQGSGRSVRQLRAG